MNDCSISLWWSAKKIKPLAILNGFGRSLGDGIIGLQAAYVAQAMGALPRPTLFHHPASSAITRELHHLAHDFVDIAMLPDAFAGTPPEPLPTEFAAKFERVIDLRDFAFDPGFRGVAMIDYFLAKLGVNPADVPAEQRRNSWLAPRVIPQHPADFPDHYVLFCPRASMPHRDIPMPQQLRMLRKMIDNQPLPVVTQGVCDDPSVLHAPTCTNIQQLCGLVAGAALIVSTDTAMVHLADAFARPCLSIFTTHDPQWRMRDYPQAVAVQMPVQGLPQALEFIRSDEDLAAINQGWADGASMLDAALIAFLAQ